MTAARQQRKSRTGPGVLLALALAGGILAPAGAKAAIGDPIVADPQSGLAISGFDPVAYFTDGKPVYGRSELELSLGGTVWRFRNEGNRAAFVAHPEVYRPSFGGYDPVAIARGRSVAGHPLFWAVVSQRLYLFYSDEARAAFLADPGRVLDRATRKWPEVERGIGH